MSCCAYRAMTRLAGEILSPASRLKKNPGQPPSLPPLLWPYPLMHLTLGMCIWPFRLVIASIVTCHGNTRGGGNKGFPLSCSDKSKRF